MQEFMSRSERRLIRLRSAAEKGLMSLDNELLYGSEIKRYEKQGLFIYHLPSTIKDLEKSKISWENAFGSEVPYPVVYYIKGITSMYPENEIKTLAQELYVIAAYVKNKKNN